MELRVKCAVCAVAMCLVLRAGSGMEHKFRYYTDNSGLSSNTIQCLYQDDKGYVWVGTADGLDRFNSYDFTNYRSDYRRRNTLENNCIYSLCGEGFPNGDRIWVGTSDGVYIFDSKDESFVHLPILGSDGRERRNLLVYSLAADVAGNMWIGTLGDGLYRYSLKSGTFEHYNAAKYPEAFSSDVIVKILLDHDNNIWVASGGGSLLSDFDISTYKGDVSLWIQFANTLKLRMAIRMSGVEPEAQRIAEEAVAAIDTYGLIDANAENLQFTLTSRRNPYYTQATSESWQDLRSNANITMYMNAYDDPRRSSYFSKSGYDETYAGVRSGIENVLPTTYASFSYPLFAETDPVPVMYAAESWFLRAEGALLGWAMGDTPENLYNTGVKPSFEQWGCSSSYEGYIASTLTPRLAYTDPAGKHDQPNFGQAVSVKWADDGHELERIIPVILVHPQGDDRADVRRGQKLDQAAHTGLTAEICRHGLGLGETDAFDRAELFRLVFEHVERVGTEARHHQ